MDKALVGSNSVNALESTQQQKYGSLLLIAGQQAEQQ
jgi:hypothetical protein